ncbi:MAG: hypothetical protein ACRDLL_00360 [Solirubrobacterales bacterium]
MEAPLPRRLFAEFLGSFAGIAPASVPAFVVVQLLGGVVGIAVIRALYPGLSPEDAAEVMLPRDDPRERTATA